MKLGEERKMLSLTLKKRKLSLALFLKDGFSDKKLKGNYEIKLQGSNISYKLSYVEKLKDYYVEYEGTRRPPVKHRTGHLLFMNLPEEEYTLTVEGNYYSKIESGVNTGTLGQKLPVFELKLNPSMIKGTITDKTGVPIEGAEIKVKERNETATTDKEGVFHLYFKDIVNSEDVILQVTMKGFQTEETRTVVREGETIDAAIILKLKEEFNNTLINGYVIDTSGSYINGATVSIAENTEVKKVQTDNEGGFTLDLTGTEISTATLRVEKTQFKTYMSENIAVIEGEKINVPSIILERKSRHRE